MLAASPLPTSRSSRATLPRGVAQLGVFLLAYLVYSAARYVTVGDLASAQDHANWIMDLENSLGVAVESSVQTTLTGTWILWLLNHAYLAAQLVVLPGALIFLYHRSRPLYERLRNTILATWLISIPVYGLFPVAPPRLADSGLVDTISTQTGFAMDSSLTTSFYNELAAVPSLHVGFAFAVGIALAASFSNPLAKLAAHLWGPAIALAVVATGNHYVFDIVAGMVAAGLGYGIGAAIARRGMQSTSAIRVPTTVSTVLVPMKNAARRSVGHRRAGDGLEARRQHREPGADRGGRERHQPGAPLGEHDEQQHRRRDRQREGGEEARQRADPADAAEQLPGQHRPGVGPRRAQRRAAARQAARDPAGGDGDAAGPRRPPGVPRHEEAAAGHDRGEHGEHRADGERRRRPEVRADAERQRGGEHDEPDQQLARALGDQRPGQDGAAGLPEPAAQQQHAHRVAAAGGHEAAGARAGHPRADRVTTPQPRVGAGGRAHQREPPAPARDLVEQVERHPEQDPPGGRARHRPGQVGEHTFQGGRRVGGCVPHRGTRVPPRGARDPRASPVRFVY